MRKLSFLLFASLILSSAGLADTLHLKNGSVLKGKVTSFADEQFIVLLDTGSGRFTSKATIYIGDVARIEFDSAPSSAEVGPPTSSQPADTARDNPPLKEPARTVQLADSQPSAAPPSKEPDAVSTDKPTVPIGSDTPDRPPRKPGPVLTATVDVIAKKDWTSTGLIVRRGDRIHITAAGTVTLDPNSGQTSGPEGSDAPDSKKLMTDKPTGSLIAVISSDNDDFIFIGRSIEFTASRDGLLFLSVNEGNLADNTGSYKAVIEVLQAQRVKP